MKSFLQRNPALAGLVFLVAGVFLVRDALVNAERYDEYSRGPRVAASVTRVDPTEDSKFRVELFWRDPDGESHRKATTTANEHGLAVRDRVPLVLHPDDSSRFLFLETLEERQAGVVEIFGVRAVNTIFVGLALAVGGLLLIVFAPRLDPGPPASARDARPRLERSQIPSTNVRLITARRVAVVTVLLWGVGSVLFSLTPAFHFSSAEGQAYSIGRIGGYLMVVGLLVATWGLVTGNEWSWGGTAVRLVVVLVLLGVVGGRDSARKTLDRPEEVKQADQTMPKRPKSEP